MTSSENFFRAAFNSVKARIKKTVIYSANETANFMKDAPEIIKKEWNEFKDEVSKEADRLEDSKNEAISMEEMDFKKEYDLSEQTRIDQLRKKIADLNNKIEEIH